MSCSCGRKHRRWNAVAKCRWPNANRVVGEGEWAVLSTCGGWTLVTLHLDRATADKTLAIIDRRGCGGSCERDHAIARLT